MRVWTWMMTILLIVGSTAGASEVTVRPFAVGAVENTETGAAFPNLSFQIGDATQRVADYQGARLVQLWASWCAPCIRELREVKALRDDPLMQGVTVIAISLDKDPRKARAVANALGADGAEVGTITSFSFPAIVDRPPRGFSVPRTYLIDAEGRLIEKRAGYEEGAVEAMLRRLEKLQAKARRRRH